MATEKTYNGDGSDKTFDITFPYLTHADIGVSVGGVTKTVDTDYTISGNTVTFGTAPASGTDNVKLYRNTNIDTAEHEYAAGSSITAASLNENQKQALYAIEEAKLVTTTSGGITTGNKNDITVNSDTDWVIRTNAVEKSMMADNSVGTDEIEANAVTASEIAANAVGASELADNAVDTAAIADNAVTMAKLNSGALPTDITVASANLVDATIATADIADDAVTLAKVADQAVDEARLQISNNPTNGNVLTAQSGNTGGLTWATPISIKPAGSVLETFTLCCTGTSAVVGSGTYQTQNVQAYQEVNTTGGWVDLTGSLMAYTPPAGTKTVLYKFNYYTRPVHSQYLYHASLMLDSDEVTAARYTPYLPANGGQELQHFEWPFIIRSSNNLSIGQVTSWSSAKTIKILVKAYSDGYTTRFHDMAYWDTNPADTMHHPTISITAIS